MLKKIRTPFYFLLTVVLLVLALKFLNYLPMAVQTDTIRRYRSVDEVRARLNIRDIYVPSYFPQGLVWPPSEILAQRRPFAAVIMEFHSAGREDTVLMISQSASTHFKPDEKIRLQRIKDRVGYPLRGRVMMLEAGVCADEEPCSRVSWAEEGYTITVTARSEPPELMKIAESMIH
jgi:hypothetical protein